MRSVAKRHLGRCEQREGESQYGTGCDGCDVTVLVSATGAEDCPCIGACAPARGELVQIPSPESCMMIVLKGGSANLQDVPSGWPFHSLTASFGSVFRIVSGDTCAPFLRELRLLHDCLITHTHFSNSVAMKSQLQADPCLSSDDLPKSCAQLSNETRQTDVMRRERNEWHRVNGVA